MANAKAVIDLTAGAGPWALAAIARHVPYFGMVLTDVHQKELTARLVREVPSPLLPAPPFPKCFNLPFSAPPLLLFPPPSPVQVQTLLTTPSSRLYMESLAPTQPKVPKAPPPKGDKAKRGAAAKKPAAPQDAEESAEDSQSGGEADA